MCVSVFMPSVSETPSPHPRVRKLLMYTRHFQKLSLLLIKLGLNVYLLKITIFLKDSYSYTLMTLRSIRWCLCPWMKGLGNATNHTQDIRKGSPYPLWYECIQICYDHTVDIWRTEFCLAIFLPFLTNSFELMIKWYFLIREEMGFKIK